MLARSLTCLAATATLAAADLPIEVHGFASFGWFRTWENAYLAPDSEEGSTELWEAAMSVVSRPADRLRLGVQIFARDLGIYDNGVPRLDYAYADYRLADAAGIQAGRVRIPSGLHQEELDVDAARTQVFLPWSVYPIRVRDFFTAVDGAKVYGFAPLSADWTGEYVVYAGVSTVDTQGGFATSLERSGYVSVQTLEPERTVGGMLQVSSDSLGITARGTIWHTTGLTVEGRTATATRSAELSQYWWAVASLAWERGPLAVTAEWSRIHFDGEGRVTPPGSTFPAQQEADGAYLAVNWQVSSWLEAYGAIEAARSQIADERLGETRALVAAVAVRPLHNWSLKAEWREMDGPIGVVSTLDNPDGVDERWRMLALKTTVDF